MTSSISSFSTSVDDLASYSNQWENRSTRRKLPETSPDPVFPTNQPLYPYTSYQLLDKLVTNHSICELDHIFCLLWLTQKHCCSNSLFFYIIFLSFLNHPHRHANVFIQLLILISPVPFPCPCLATSPFLCSHLQQNSLSTLVISSSFFLESTPARLSLPQLYQNYVFMVSRDSHVAKSNDYFSILILLNLVTCDIPSLLGFHYITHYWFFSVFLSIPSVSLVPPLLSS